MEGVWSRRHRARTVHAAGGCAARALARKWARARHVRSQRESSQDASGTPARRARGGNASGGQERNAGASAGVKPSAPGSCGQRCDSERAETRAHVVEKRDLVGCRRRSDGPGSPQHRSHAVRSARPSRGCAPARVTTVTERRDEEPSSAREVRALGGAVRAAPRAKPVTKRVGHARTGRPTPRCASRVGHDGRRQGRGSSFARAETILGGEDTSRAATLGE